MDIIAQYAIFILGPAAVFIVGMKNKYRRWGYIVGLACQPFWFITLYYNKQWPVFAVAFLYTASWAQGAYNHFIKDGVNQ